MSETHPRHPIALKRVVYKLEGMEAVAVQSEHRCGTYGAVAVSAHVPVALSTLMRQPQKFGAAVLSNGYTLDLEGTAVADAFRNLGLVSACEGRSMEDLPPDVPLFIARSGQDEVPGLNQALDRFVAAASGASGPKLRESSRRSPRDCSWKTPLCRPATVHGVRT